MNGFVASIGLDSLSFKQICHAVSSPPAVHDKSAVLAVTFEEDNAVGFIQEGAKAMLILSTKIAPLL